MGADRQESCGWEGGRSKPSSREAVIGCLAVGLIMPGLLMSRPELTCTAELILNGNNRQPLLPVHPE